MQIYCKEENYFIYQGGHRRFNERFPGGHALKKAVVRGWEDLYFTGSVQNDWYSEIEEEINAAMQPGSSILSPYTALPEAPENASSPRALDTYCGSYYQNYYGNLMIEHGADDRHRRVLHHR